ncbi:hypothetical protein JCM12294_08680 [Desulfocicer niacini]
MSFMDEMRQAQATIPVASAKKMEISEIKKVDLSPPRKRGIYSIMILKLKSVSMTPSVSLDKVPFLLLKGTHVYAGGSVYCVTRFNTMDQ